MSAQKRGNQLNTRTLKDALRRANIDERFVSLDGSARDESLVLEHDSVMGWTVYSVNAASAPASGSSDSEDKACQFILDQLKRSNR